MNLKIGSFFKGEKTATDIDIPDRTKWYADNSGSKRRRVQRKLWAQKCSRAAETGSNWTHSFTRAQIVILPANQTAFEVLEDCFVRGLTGSACW
jgi:hypothetical protein